LVGFHPAFNMGHLGNQEPMEESYVMLIAFGVLAMVSPVLLCIWRYHTPFADEKYRIEHKKWAEAVKRRKESKKASRKASKELADSRKNSRGASSRNVRYTRGLLQTTWYRISAN
jgi:hypothetical protein